MPPLSSSIRRWPSDSDCARPDWTLAMVSSSIASSSRCASAQASSEVSRVITCMRMPKRSSRPSASASPRIQAIFSATAAGGSPQVR